MGEKGGESLERRTQKHENHYKAREVWILALGDKIEEDERD